MNLTNICNYIFELGTLKKFHHSGTKLAGVQQPDTIAEHAHRTAIIGYILAKMENIKNPEKVAMMCLIHDNAESRITDLHKLAQRYIDKEKSEKRAFREQVENLPDGIGQLFEEYFLEYEDKTSPAGRVAYDADLLETAFQAKEYIDLGYTICQDWINNVEKDLTTAGAKKLLQAMKKVHFYDWWQGLKKSVTRNL